MYNCVAIVTALDSSAMHKISKKGKKARAEIIQEVNIDGLFQPFGFTIFCILYTLTSFNVCIYSAWQLLLEG